MIDLNLNIPQVLEFLLKEKYRSEFRNWHGIMQHPSHGNFYDWLYQNDLISTSNYFEICEELKNEKD